MKKIILESLFSGLQKTVLFLYLMFRTLSLAFDIDDEFTAQQTIYLTIDALLILLFFIAAFLKKGLLRKDGKLKSCWFLFGLEVYSKTIVTENRPKASILKYGLGQRSNLFNANTDKTKNLFDRFEVFLLDDTHYQRTLVTRLRSEENAKRAIAFLEKNFDRKHEVFSPSYS